MDWKDKMQAVLKEVLDDPNNTWSISFIDENNYEIVLNGKVELKEWYKREVSSCWRDAIRNSIKTIITQRIEKSLKNK